MAMQKSGEQSGIEVLKRLYASGYSLIEISDISGVPVSTARRHLINAGVAMRSKKDGQLLARAKGRGGAGRPKGFKNSESAKQRMSQAKRAWAEENAVGLRITSSGYAGFTRGANANRLVHSVIMEMWLGRPLEGFEIVHHIDGDRLNNAPDNLALVTRSGHARLHRFEDKLAGIERDREKNGTWS